MLLPKSMKAVQALIIVLILPTLQHVVSDREKYSNQLKVFGIEPCLITSSDYYLFHLTLWCVIFKLTDAMG